MPLNKIKDFSYRTFFFLFKREMESPVTLFENVTFESPSTIQFKMEFLMLKNGRAIDIVIRYVGSSSLSLLNRWGNLAK